MPYDEDTGQELCDICEEYQANIQQVILELRKLEEPLKNDFPLTAISYAEPIEEKSALLKRRDYLQDELAKHQRYVHLGETPPEQR